MSIDIRNVKDMNGLITYFAEKLDWNIDLDDFEDIEDITYDFDASDIGLKDEEFAKIQSLRQLPPLVDGQKWGIFCVEFDSKKFEVTALRKILSGLVPKRRNAADHAVWNQKDLLFICFWGSDNNRTIGIAHFEDVESGLPQIKMIHCAPATEDAIQIRVFESRLSKLAWPKDTSDTDGWRSTWADAFVTGYRQVVQDASTLTVKLAEEAQGIRNRILDIFKVESPNGYVHLLFDKFRNTLIHDMTEQQFADMYAQTVVYGLFSARCMDSSQENFSADEAINCIPNTNPFLKSLMKECIGTENNSKLSFDELEIENVVELLRKTKTEAIIADFNRQTGGGREDPVIHFYEEFLTAYDKVQKVQRGVYYTPQPVVNFIVRAVDSILKDEFGLEDGLASTEMKKVKYMRENERKVGLFVEDTKEDYSIQVLDPATGTGTFIRQTILQIYENFKSKRKEMSKEQLDVAWNAYVPKYLLPRLNAFELMMAPYAVAHMKLAMVLKDTGYNFKNDARLRVYLTNALEEPGNSEMQLSFLEDPLAVESIEANGAKKNAGINIVIGNPPYAGESQNKNAWISSLMEDYKKEPGGISKLNEKNPKWLNDDYVKFIRLSQHFIEKTSYGIMAFICPHGFIDNPTFRGMRWNLATYYDKIYILDLHGNAKKKEVCPDGSKDENVFDIQQGVCIVLMIHKSSRKSRLAQIFHSDLFGARDFKYQKLNKMFLGDIEWKQVNCSEPFFLFKPTNESASNFECYDISKLFMESVMGFQTHRDEFAVAFEKETIQSRLRDMENSTLDDDTIKNKYNLKDNRDWQIHKARNRIIQTSEEQRSNRLTQCQYRLFDKRWCYLDEGFMDYPRSNVFCHVSNRDNVVFGVGRQGLAVGDIEWCLAYISHYAFDANIFRRGGITSSPLYLYRNDLSGKTRVPNLEMDIVRNFEKITSLSFTEEKIDEDGTFAPIDVIDYTYAILYSHKYRSMFSDQLKIDYPKIPYPIDAEYFWKMVDFGKSLRNIHTMDEIPDTNSVVFVGTGDNAVEKYQLKNGRVFINSKQYFEQNNPSITEAVWNYTIGGNQPLQKWLKDRKGLKLSNKDVQHYKGIIAAIEKTMELMDRIDEVIEL